MVRVVKANPRVRLLMVGGDSRGDFPTALKDLAVKLGLGEHVIFTGLVPRSEVVEYIAASNVGVSPIPPVPIYWVSSPTKLVETLGMARPVVANDLPEQKKILLESHGGLCVPYDEAAFADALLRLLSDPLLAQEMGRAGRKYIEAERSYQQMALTLEAIYRDLLSTRKGGGK